MLEALVVIQAIAIIVLLFILFTKNREAQRDYLTGLLNRRPFIRSLERITRRKKGFAVILIDLDEFKPINDTHGHAAGDEVLIGVAKRISSGIRNKDVACRYGGDEFAVIIKASEEKEALHVAERLHEAISCTPHRINDEDFYITVSMGGAYVRPGETIDQLIERADAALYSVKEDGRHGLEFDQKGG